MKPSTVYNDFVPQKQKSRKIIDNNNIHQLFHFIKANGENESEQQAPLLLPPGYREVSL